MIEEVSSTTRHVDGQLPIEDYGAIGDGRTLALVGVDGSIDWMCLPDLDGPSVFAALLDPARGGSFALAPAVPYRSTQRYLPDTNVLETEFTTDAGVVRVRDALTVDTAQNAPWRELVREVECVTGSVPMHWRLRPRFDYGRGAPEPVAHSGALIWRHNKLQFGFKSWDAGEPEVSGAVASASFELREGQRALLALLASEEAALPSPERSELERRLQATVELWRDWVSRCTYEGPWRDAVHRSLLAIRLLADGRTGAITAAGTTSLPEQIGGDRNYDYRFGWVRDLSLTVDALLRVGMKQLAHASVGWLLDSVAHTHPRVDPVYALTGKVVRDQQPLPLSGYRGSAPVRLGNQAGSQLQLGGVGYLLETIWHYTGAGYVLAPHIGERLADCADLLCAIWSCPDSGLWELGQLAHYTTSKVGAWSAFERILQLADRGQVPSRHLGRWRATRDEIHRFVESELWSESRGSYLMKAGSDKLDCGVLLTLRRGFTDPAGPQMTGTIAAIQSELHAGGPLYYRYSGMQDEENAFLACSFWMIDALALAGRHDEAAELMDGIVSLGSRLGLYSEELDPSSHAMRGNFPQALTHLALISAAAMLQEHGN